MPSLASPRPRRALLELAAALALVLVAAPHARADSIALSWGLSLEGAVVQNDGERVQFDCAQGRFEVPRGLIANLQEGIAWTPFETASGAATRAAVSDLIVRAPPTLVEDLVALGPAAAPYMVAFALAGDPARARPLLEAAGRSEEPGWLILAAFARSRQRLEAIRACGRLRVAGAVAPLLSIAAGSDAMAAEACDAAARAGAAHAATLDVATAAFGPHPERRDHFPRFLARLGSSKAIEQLGDLWRSPDAATRRRALDAARFAAPGRIPVQALLHSMLDQDRRIRNAAAVAAGYAGDLEAVPDLIARLDGEPDEAADAHGALVRLTRQSLPPERAAWSEWWEPVKAEVASLGDLTDDALEGDAVKRRAAIARLGALPDWHATDALIRLATGEEREWAIAACDAFTAATPEYVAPSLVQVLRSSDPAVRTAAGDALRRITGKLLPAEPRAWAQAIGEP